MGSNVLARLSVVAVPELSLTDPVHDGTMVSSLFMLLFADAIDLQLWEISNDYVVFWYVLFTNNKLKLSEGAGIIDRLRLGLVTVIRMSERERRST